MIVTLNDPTPFAGKRMGGIVFYRFYDILCARRYVVPRDPRTDSQRERRAAFGEAVAAWRSLSEGEKEAWRARGRAAHRSGYNAFMAAFLRGDAAEGVSPVETAVETPVEGSRPVRAPRSGRARSVRRRRTATLPGTLLRYSSGNAPLPPRTHLVRGNALSCHYESWPLRSVKCSGNTLSLRAPAVWGVAIS
ncbi:MAG: hypothetical protein MUC76_12565 [Spirochaetes bacterium]|jgi:hypothetical protein|nr:hypothetical protein [Spirochaetota bacterium]